MKKAKIMSVLLFLMIVFSPTIFGYETGREVYVRHIDKDGGGIISGIENTEQVVTDSSGTLSLLSNSNSMDVDSSAYSEYYSFNLEDEMTISKSLVILRGGYNYTYLGYVRRTDTSYDVALSYADSQKRAIISGTGEYDVEYDNNDNSTTTYTIEQKSENDVTIIDFYYSKSSTEEKTVKLQTKSSATPTDATLISSEVTYVPAFAQLEVYYDAPKYYATELAYKKSIVDNKVEYVISSYLVNVARTGTLENSSAIEKDGKLISGDVVGNGDSYVITGTGGSNLVVDVSNSIDELISGINISAVDKVENYNTKTNQKLITGDTLTDSNFANSYTVNYNAYNGLRSAKGTLTYVSYNVLTGATGGTTVKSSTNEHYINVYTPIQMDTPVVSVTSGQEINHSSTSSSTIILSDDATFTIGLRSGDSQFFSGVSDNDKNKFISAYFLIFDFDVVHNGKTYTKGTAIRMSAIGKETVTFDGQVASNETLSRDASNHKIIIIAAASNTPGIQAENIPNMVQAVVDQEYNIQVDGSQSVTERKYINDSGNNEAQFSANIKDAVTNNGSEYTGVTMYADGYYFAMKTAVIRTVSRIYDFRITDCTDLAYKSAFRNSNNELIGNSYFSGTRRLFVYTNSNNKEYTSILTRNDDDLYIYGTSSTKTLPLGPYKHTTATYTKAPKLGYRIAFDLKTSGYYLADGNDTTSRKIIIKPSYYYISKDGQTIIKNINLYYKDESGKYKNFEGSNYTIYFTPNDGYRTSNSTTSNTSTMSTSSIGLNIGSSSGEFYLTDYMMSSDDSNYIQSWYGEFKLPNTTIAVREGDSIDNVLTDGYIAVKFNITCSDTVLNETITYNSEDSSASSKTNTTQWDYEGYLGFANPGQAVTSDTSLRLQLEKGIWVIDSQETYDFVKGTVVLYDTDERAADDIQ